MTFYYHFVLALLPAVLSIALASRLHQHNWMPQLGSEVTATLCIFGENVCENFIIMIMIMASVYTNRLRFLAD